MSFEPRPSQTRLPSLPGMLLSIIVIALIIGGAYFFVIKPPANENTGLSGAPPDSGSAADPLDQNPGMRPERITIPAIGVDGPVLEMRIGLDGLWDADSIIGEVGHLEGTPIPGQGGNSVMAAHVTVPDGAYGPFKDLELMQVGNTVSVWARNGTLYTYEVTGNTVVLATAIEVVAPTPEPTLTLITCTGWDENQRTYLERVVVRARLQSVTPPTS